MTTREQTTDTLDVSVEGIGGIESTTVTLDRGVNVLEGRNATNRTSLLQAIMAGLGSTAVSLKGDREEGSVELDIGGETATRTLKREGDTVQFSGDPFLSETTEADLFAFLLESSETRQAVTSGDNLRDVIMRPVDTYDIERQTRNLRKERNGIDSRLETLKTRRRQLPTLEEKRVELEAELDEAEEALAEARKAFDAADGDVETKQEQKERLEETLDELSEAQSDLDDIQYRLETERKALNSAREELETKQTQLDELPALSDRSLTEIEEEISELRQQKRVYDTRVSKLHRIVQFNEEMLEGEGVLDGVFEQDDGPVTDELLGDAGTTRCWTCGSAVSEGEIAEMLDRLREVSQAQRRNRNELEAKLEEVTNERDRLTDVQQRREKITEAIASLTADIERREETLEDLETSETTLHNRIDELESEASRLDGVAESRVLELQKAVAEQEITCKRLEREREQVTEKIESLEATADKISELETKREQVTEQLRELQTRIDRLEAESVNAFNEHMEELVELLEYDNIARVWLERRKEGTTGRDGAESTFELHIVRTSETGIAYEDTVDHLSESEREVVGLVFALAGYLVHEVYETVPFMLLDSLEAIDSERIATLIEYLTDYAPTIVAALLPEDADALDGSYTRIENI